jgi:hypothetical protein
VIACLRVESITLMSPRAAGGSADTPNFTNIYVGKDQRC